MSIIIGNRDKKDELIKELVEALTEANEAFLEISKIFGIGYTKDSLIFKYKQLLEFW